VEGSKAVELALLFSDSEKVDPRQIIPIHESPDDKRETFPSLGLTIPASQICLNRLIAFQSGLQFQIHG
jgi:hypothetical protein